MADAADLTSVVRVQVESRLVIEFCCKVAVIFPALYAVKLSVFCSNDCFPAENGYLFFGRYCMQVVK